MSKVIKYLPELEGEEQVFVAQLYKDLGEEQAIQFANVYRQRRKDATTTLLMTVLGFIVVAGIQRFYLGQIGMGLAYFFTGGFCLIGTIVDAVNYRSLTETFNEKQALEVASLIRGAFPPEDDLSHGVDSDF
jgi:TM2 domain-containing membrane protein YozV